MAQYVNNLRNKKERTVTNIKPFDKIIQNIKDSDKKEYPKTHVLSIAKNISTMIDRDMVSVDQIRRGDVFWGHNVGGKQRPWIVLSCKAGLVVSVAMSTGDKAPRMVQSQCRLWAGKWIGSTVSVFCEEYAGSRVTRPYTNIKHLREIEASLSEIMGLRK